MDNIKICYTASAGGHIYELLQMDELLEKYHGILITESKNVPKTFEAVYTVGLVNRKSIRNYFRFAKSFFPIWKILKKERPTHIVSFGAMCTVPVCIIGKLMKIKVKVLIQIFKTIKRN